MQIQSSRIDLPNPQPTPGLLIGVENPSRILAEEAKSILNLSNPPGSLLIGIPAGSVTFTGYDKAIIDTGVSVARTISTELAKSSNSPVIKYGVKALWLGVGFWKIYNKYNEKDKNIPALLLETTKTGLDLVELGLDVADIKTGFFDNKILQENVGMIFTAAGAVAKGDDLAMALTNKKFGSTDAGKFLGLMTPMLNAAISKDPAFKNIKFSPLPQIVTPKEEKKNS